jgi:hypothetical protein
LGGWFGAGGVSLPQPLREGVEALPGFGLYAESPLCCPGRSDSTNPRVDMIDVLIRERDSDVLLSVDLRPLSMVARSDRRFARATLMVCRRSGTPYRDVRMLPRRSRVLSPKGWPSRSFPADIPFALRRQIWAALWQAASPWLHTRRMRLIRVAGNRERLMEALARPQTMGLIDRYRVLGSLACFHRTFDATGMSDIQAASRLLREGGIMARDHVPMSRDVPEWLRGGGLVNASFLAWARRVSVTSRYEGLNMAGGGAGGWTWVDLCLGMADVCRVQPPEVWARFRTGAEWRTLHEAVFRSRDGWLAELVIGGPREFEDMAVRVLPDADPTIRSAALFGAMENAVHADPSRREWGMEAWESHFAQQRT